MLKGINKNGISIKGYKDVELPHVLSAFIDMIT